VLPSTFSSCFSTFNKTICRGTWRGQVIERNPSKGESNQIFICKNHGKRACNFIVCLC